MVGKEASISVSVSVSATIPRFVFLTRNYWLYSLNTIISAYEITYTSKHVQVPVLEILFDGKPISQSPVRLMVEELDCAAIYGEGSNREPDAEGNCVCAGNTSELGGTCMESQFFFLIIFALVALAMAVIVFFYLGYKKKQNGMLVLLAVSFSRFRYDLLLPAHGFYLLLLFCRLTLPKDMVWHINPE